MSSVALTTVDNPYDPFNDFYSWFMFDESKGYHSCSYIGRIAKTSEQLSDEENDQEIEKAIDLVSIADSLDAATDIFGRNYTTPKSVDDVLLEFQSLKGSRYNPNLIQLISNDNELVSKLRQMTKDDRAMIYYYAVKELEER